MASTKAAQAVREYLNFLDGSEARTKIDGRSKDPLMKLAAIAIEDRAAGVENAFVEHAKAYSESEDIPVEAWRKVGIPEPVLRRARLVVGPGRPATSKGSPGRTTPPNTSAKKAAKRTPSLDLDQVLAKAPRGKFRVRELAEKIGRDVATTRNYLIRLEADKKIKMVGEDNSGRGKPAKIYQRL